MAPREIERFTSIKDIVAKTRRGELQADAAARLGLSTEGLTATPMLTENKFVYKFANGYGCEVAPNGNAICVQDLPQLGIPSDCYCDTYNPERVRRFLSAEDANAYLTRLRNLPRMFSGAPGVRLIDIGIDVTKMDK